MKGRMLASVVMTAIGASLLAATMFASTAAGAGAAATAKKGGSLTIVNRSDFDYVDPGLAYFSHSWNMMGATQLTLLYYPQTEAPAHNRLAGMAASMPKVSKDGTTYVFTVKKGFRFSDGTSSGRWTAARTRPCSRRRRRSWTTSRATRQRVRSSPSS